MPEDLLKFAKKKAISQGVDSIADVGEDDVLAPPPLPPIEEPHIYKHI